MATDLLDDPLSDLFDAPKRRRRKSDPLDDLFDTPDPAPTHYELNPEEEQSILGMLGSGTMSALGWAGEVLDKYSGDRAIRGLLGGKPRELASIIPLSDYFGITRREDMTSGKDLLKWDDPNSWWDDIAGMGTEIGLGIANPVSWIGSAAEALTDAGKIAKLANISDDAVRVANAVNKGKNIGGFEAQMTTTLRQLLDNAHPMHAQATRKAVEDAATELGKKLPEVLDQPLGHRLGWKVPFTDIGGPLPGFAAGDELGLAAARASDWLGEKLMGDIPFTKFSPLRSLNSIFNPDVQGAGTKWAQDPFATHTRAANAAEEALNQQAIELMDMAPQIAQAMGKSVDETEAMLRSTLEGIDQHFEPTGDLLPHQLHRNQFMEEQDKLLRVERQKEYGGLGAFESAATPDQKKLLDAFHKNPNSVTWKALVDSQGANGPIGPLKADDIKKAEGLIRGNIGDFGLEHEDVVANALNKWRDATESMGHSKVPDELKVPQWAISSAEEKMPGQIAKLRPRPDVSMFPDHVQKQLHGIWDRNDLVPDVLAKEGKNTHYLVDAYSTRYLTRRASGLEQWQKDIARDIDLKHFPGGTASLKAMLADVAEKSGGDVGKMSDILEQDYGPVIARQIEAEAKMATGKGLPPEEAAEAFQDRVQGIAQTLGQMPEEARKAGIFGNESPFEFRLHHQTKLGQVASLSAGNDAAASFIQENFHKGFKPKKGAMAIPAGEGVKLSKVAAELNLTMGRQGGKDGWLRALYNRMGWKVPDTISGFDKAVEQLRNVTIPQDLANDILKSHGTFDAPDAVKNLLGMYDSFTQLFKTAVLTWPARYVRDFFSGQVHSMLTGNWSGKVAKEAYDLLGGEVSDSWKRFQPVKDILTRQGIDPAKATAEQATHAARMHLAAMNLGQGPTSEIMRTSQATGKEVMESLPGVKPNTISGAAANAVEGLDWSNAFDRLTTIEGVNGAKETLNPVVKLGNSAGAYTDAMNRYVPYLTMLDQGYSPAAARARVMAQQVDYSGKAVSKFESTVMARLFPFYKFTKGMAKGMVDELWKHPRGGLGTTIRAQGALSRQEEGEFIPEHLRQGMAFKLPGSDETTAHYLSGMGLMHEGPLELLRPGLNTFDTVQGMLQEVGGKMNPIPKTLVELATGKQLYSGRDLRDLDGSLARTISNAGITGEPPQTGILLEEAVAASPLSRLISTIRTATDPRKDLIHKAANLGTGFRVETVDVKRAKTLQARKAIEEMLRGEPGVKRFEHYFAEDESKLSPTDKLLMSLYRRMSAEQTKANREKKQPKKDAMEELLGI